MKQLNFNEDQKTSYAVPLALRDEQIRLAIKATTKRIEPHPLRKEPIAIVGFGPSLQQTWKKIKRFKYVMACSGASAFLIERGVVPTYHVAVDPLPGNTVKLIGQPHKKVEYLIASTCHPDVFAHLKGYNVRLWHVFAEDEVVPVLPRGEWALTGGCDVGLRCLVLACFLGFTNQHIFGLDGSSPDTTARHAGDHPVGPKGMSQVEYEGKSYWTTPAMLTAAKSVFHELDQLPKITPHFYGEGLIQDMARKWSRKPTQLANAIAITRPELISPKMLDLNAELHRSNSHYGMGGAKYADKVRQLCRDLNTHSVLDYGAGKQQLARSLEFPIWSYDPAIPEISASPRPADIVLCTDVLEHIEPDKLEFVLDDLKRVTKRCGYFVIHKGAAVKTYADGQNTHLIQQGKEWWTKQLAKHFQIAKVDENEHELHFGVVPMPEKPKPEMVRVEEGGTVVKFLTPNDTTKWRANTLLKKEPATISWIDTFEAGEVLYDIGANIGGYTVWAAKRRAVTPYAFEPQADNYALLVQNMRVNGLAPNAYCVALNDKPTLSELHLSSSSEVGGSCHSFAEDADPFGKPRKQGNFHGAVGLTLDQLVELGLPKPNHIKIDVDGFEGRVVRGAEKVLSNCSVKSLLVEVNDELPEHRAMVAHLQELGYTYDPVQVENARRKSGPFKGVAEYVFRRVNKLERQLLDRIAEAEVQTLPFPHFHLTNILPPDTFAELAATLPKKYIHIAKVRGKGLAAYKQRFVAEPTTPLWQELTTALRNGAIKQALCRQFAVNAAGLTDETLLIRDLPGYSIGPHTDSPAKVISALFYLQGSEGTSMYVPRAKNFTCAGGPHYPFNRFKRVARVPFTPNSLFCFLKTDHSFHGVEPTKHQRDVLLYDIRRGA